MPNPYDTENDFVSMVIVFEGTLKKVARWMERTKTIEIDAGAITYEHDGSQKVLVKLSDSAGKKRNYDFNLVIDCPKPPAEIIVPLTFE
jgi:hypothetical protein